MKFSSTFRRFEKQNNDYHGKLTDWFKCWYGDFFIFWICNIPFGVPSCCLPVNTIATGLTRVLLDWKFLRHSDIWMLLRYMGNILIDEASDHCRPPVLNFWKPSKNHRKRWLACEKTFNGNGQGAAKPLKSHQTRRCLLKTYYHRIVSKIWPSFQSMPQSVIDLW